MIWRVETETLSSSSSWQSSRRDRTQFIDIGYFRDRTRLTICWALSAPACRCTSAPTWKQMTVGKRADSVSCCRALNDVFIYLCRPAADFRLSQVTLDAGYSIRQILFLVAHGVTLRHRRSESSLRSLMIVSIYDHDRRNAGSARFFVLAIVVRALPTCRWYGHCIFNLRLLTCDSSLPHFRRCAIVCGNAHLFLIVQRSFVAGGTNLWLSQPLM